MSHSRIGAFLLLIACALTVPVRAADESETQPGGIAAGAESTADETADDRRSHWSFQAIQRPEPPAAGAADWARNPIDAFVARKHGEAKVVARPLADRHVLLRRVYLDLIGLPPSREQLRAFLADESPDAYERMVDSLLVSPHHGERWGRHWLDVWRYSDWYGFQNEVRFSQKNIWHWRDWVVESINADKGYERMVMEMLAGDEIVPFEPGNLRATGFLVRNRNTDSREQWIRDTVEHTAKAFLGLTMACVQCHDHPYDPILHEEYYRLRSIFEPAQVGIDSGGGGPGGEDLAGVARIFDRDQNAVTKFYIRGNDRTPDEDRKITPGVPQVFNEWTEPKAVSLPPLARVPQLREPVHQQTMARLQYNVRQAEQAIVSAEKFLAETEQRIADNSTDDATPAADTFAIDAFQEMQSSMWRQGRGRWDTSQGHLAQTLVGEQRDCWIEAVRQPPPNFSLRLRLRITGGTERLVGVMFNRSPDGGRGQAVLLSADPGGTGLKFFFEYGDERHYYEDFARPFPVALGEEFMLRLDVRDRLVNVYVNDLLQQACEVNSAEPGAFRLMTIDASVDFPHLRLDPLPDDVPLAPAGTIPLLSPIARLDKSHPSHVEFASAVIDQSVLQLDVHQAEFASYQATRSADAWKQLSPPTVDDDAAVKAHQIRHDQLAIAAHAAQRVLALAKAKVERFKAEHELKGATERADAGEAADEKLAQAVTDAKQKLEAATTQVATAETSIHEPPVPAYEGLPGSYGSSSGRRLALAHWVADSENPLTARVAVNHIWLRHFGRALVGSVFDFGLNGQQPTHPELLDWLACELMQPSLVLESTGQDIRWVAGNPIAEPWSMKHLHRLIVTSRAYRSASTPDKNNLHVDPNNRWCWRMPAQRMDAETVRDGLLAVAGQLDKTLGGPDLPCSDGMSVHRRSIYFHQSPEKQMVFLKLFDGADPTECYHRHVSVVPHQALALFNSELAVAQSRLLARRMSQQIDGQDAFIQAAFEQVLGRPVSVTESKICRDFLAARMEFYQSHGKPETAAGNTGESDRPAADPRLHARENLVHSLFNHHDFVTIK